MTIKNIIKHNKGGAAKGLLIFAGIIAVAIIITFIVIKVTGEPPAPPDSPDENGVEEPYQPVYEAVIGDIKFIFLEAEDKGDILRGSESAYPQWQKDLTTKEKFIRVTIGAQNIGKENIPERLWGLGEVIDNEERVFEPLGNKARAWIVAKDYDYEEDQCAVLLKPGFSPLPCVRIYEVAKVSTDFKIKVFFKTKKGISDDREEAIIDLFISP